MDLQNADCAGRPNIVERNARVLHGVKGIGSSAVYRRRRGNSWTSCFLGVLWGDDSNIALKHAHAPHPHCHCCHALPMSPTCNATPSLSYCPPSAPPWGTWTQGDPHSAMLLIVGLMRLQILSQGQGSGYRGVRYPYPLGPSCTIPQSIGEIARYIQVIW